MTIDKRREENLKSNIYKELEAEIFEDLDTAFVNLKSSDLTMRKKSAKRLSWNSRRETFYSVRVWFLQDGIMEELFDRIIEESDEKTKADLVRTLLFFYDRYIKQDNYWNWSKEEQIVNKAYIKMLLDFAHSLIDKASTDVLFETANILLYLEDNTGWDIYSKVLVKRNNINVMEWFSRYYSRYGDTITVSQKIALIDVITTIIQKSKNSIVIQIGTYVKADLLLRFSDGTGWDMYADTLESYNCISLIKEFRNSCILYADKSMSKDQSIRLSKILTNTIKNCKDNYIEGIQNYVTSYAKESLDICKKYNNITYINFKE